ncbi:MAG: exodeoxyribonuclease III [bacterium]|jgi:exodeoxyribonuclease-3
MKLFSWNVNGIRAALSKGFKEWLAAEQPDILGVQETKIAAGQLAGAGLEVPGYHSYWSCGERKGYSGVGLYTKEEPLAVAYGLGIEEFDREGRIIVADYPAFRLLNIYFPNGQSGEERLAYKLAFYDAVIAYCRREAAAGKNIVIGGDFNTAHREIDLKNPKQNENYSGFLPVERAKLDEFLAAGFVDSFRHFYPQKVQYSWWSYRFNARARDVGWRIDYYYVSESFLPALRDASILGEVTGSDHCPVALFIA